MLLSSVAPQPQPATAAGSVTNPAWPAGRGGPPHLFSSPEDLEDVSVCFFFFFKFNNVSSKALVNVCN